MKRLDSKAKAIRNDYRYIFYQSDVSVSKADRLTVQSIYALDDNRWTHPVYRCSRQLILYRSKVSGATVVSVAMTKANVTTKVLSV